MFVVLLSERIQEHANGHARLKVRILLIFAFTKYSGVAEMISNNFFLNGFVTDPF